MRRRGHGPTPMNEALVRAAQRGDRTALERLLAESLPLVYNIVGRALEGHPDVDDVVQEALLRVAGNLADLKQPAAYRSWMAAIVIRKIRDWIRAEQQRRERRAAHALDEQHADPASDFTALTILRLGLTDQRREVAEATRWLDPDDRDLLALWWLEETGELTRADVATALAVPPRHAAVRVQRMKEQVNAARLIVRALAAAERSCLALEELGRHWDRVPSPLWRKRFARHIRDCDRCGNREDRLVPVEQLLGGLPLLAPPPGLRGAVAEAVRAGHPGAGGRHPRAHRRGGPRPRARRLLLPAAAATAVAIGAGLLAAQQGPSTPVAARTPAETVTAAPTSPRPAAPRTTTRSPAAVSAPTRSPRPTARKGVAVWSFPQASQALALVRPTWYYTWSTGHPGIVTPQGSGFVPMIWGAASVTTQALDQARRSGPYLLGFNEPDMSGQADLTVDQALGLWPKLMSAGRILGSPAVAYGGDTPGGWLDRFMSGAAQRGYRVDFIALHWYGADFSTPDAVAQLRAYLAAVHARYGKPIWLTEYTLTDFSHGTRYPTDAQQAAFLTASTAMLDRLPYVQRYAWFGLGAADPGPGTTLYRSGTGLTPEGRAFIAAAP